MGFLTVYTIIELKKKDYARENPATKEKARDIFYARVKAYKEKKKIIAGKMADMLP